MNRRTDRNRNPYGHIPARYAVRQIGQRVIGRNTDNAVQATMRGILETL